MGQKEKEKEGFALNTDLFALLLQGNRSYRTFQCPSTVKTFTVRDKVSAGFGMKVPLSQAGLISDAVCNSLNCLVSISANGISGIELCFYPCILTIKKPKAFLFA